MIEPLALLVTALVGALSAFIAAYIAIRKFPAERRQAEASTAATWTDAQSVVIVNLREENKSLRQRLDTYESAMETLQRRDREMQKRIRELEDKERWMAREIAVLRERLEEAGIDAPEFRPQE